MNSGPLDIAWAGQRLVQSTRHLILEFADLATDEPCRFVLSPSAPRLPVVYPESTRSRLGQMAYQCYPRVALTGTVGSSRVRGWAWFDHQWGDLDWFVGARPGGSLLGWDWFGVALDDGTDVMATLHRDLRTGEVLSRHATVREADGRTDTTDRFHAEPIEWWVSPRTRATYPVAWRLFFDDRDLNLTILPLAQDQEISIPGPARAIWEGAAAVRAERGSRFINGRGRLELYGRAHIDDPRKTFHDIRLRIDRHLEAFLPRQPPADNDVPARVAAPVKPWYQQSRDYAETIGEPAWDMLARGGKRWRPLFGVLLLDALQTPSEPYEALIAVAAELPHTGALIIDDIQDRSDSRRGRPSLHVTQGVDTAINVGNTLYFAPFEMLARTPLLSDAQRLDAFQAMTGSLLRAHLGQGTDIRLGRLAAACRLDTVLSGDLEQDVLRSYRQKTGAVLASIAELATIVAAPAPEVRRKTVAFAESLGVAFQIVDDVLNLSGDPDLGKTAGEDLREGKLTYVIIRTLKVLPQDAARRLWSTLASAAQHNGAVEPTDSLALIRDSGVLGDCRREAMDLFDRSWSAWCRHVEPSDARLMLGVLCRKVLKRGYVS
jgi:geranylgeranyl pyrophosphate synthase